MSNNPTVYPYRQALKISLKNLLIQYAIPAINKDISSRMTSVDPSKIPQFSDTNVIIGQLLNVGEPTICIINGGEDDEFFTNRHYNCWLGTDIQIKTPWACDNTPEDFDIFFDIVVDTLRDLFNGPKGLIIQPVNPITGSPLLVEGQSFQNCCMKGARPMNFPNYRADTKTNCRGHIINHLAMVDYSFDRPYPLGG